MAAVPSTMIPLGSIAPAFELPDTQSGKILSLRTLSAGKKATLIMFICNHCPYVKHLNKALVELSNEYLQKNIAIIAISSNDAVQYPQDGPEEMKKHALQEGYPFPYLYDENQLVAKAYDAACTPDFFLYNESLALIYRGQFDASRPKNDIPVSGEDLRRALEASLQGLILEHQLPSIGCNIKWK
ncbi:MAG: thioredoxin family protein [Cytophagaceae bacterium]|nr:thioredoxin family protein [Cytophagaceae bacterium]